MTRFSTNTLLTASLLALVSLVSTPAPAADREEGDLVVPWPGSMRLLDVAEGLREGNAVLPGRCGEFQVVEDDHASELLSGVLLGIRQELRLLRSMRRLAIRSADGTVGRQERLLLAAEFQELMERVQEVAESYHFQGMRLLAGGGFVCLESDPLWIIAFDFTPYGLAIEALQVDTLVNAAASLDDLDTAIDILSYIKVRTRLTARAVEDGRPTGGLREQRRILRRMRRLAVASAIGTLGFTERLLIDDVFQHDVRRLEDVAGLASYDGIRLLDGGATVCLQGSPPRGTTLCYEAPDEGPLAADGWIGVNTDANAQVAVLAIDNALGRITEQRKSVRELRSELTLRPIPSIAFRDRRRNSGDADETLQRFEADR